MGGQAQSALARLVCQKARRAAALTGSPVAAIIKAQFQIQDIMQTQTGRKA